MRTSHTIILSVPDDEGYFMLYDPVGSWTAVKGCSTCAQNADHNTITPSSAETKYTFYEHFGAFMQD